MPKKPPSKPYALRGTVLAHNISPKGDVEGVLVDTPRGLAQLNFSKHGDEARAKALPIGASVDVAAEPEDDEGEHPVYRAMDASGGATGTVVRFNYARHGEINGYHLDDATFVHVKPDGAKRYKLKIGDRIAVEGQRHSGRDAVVLEATRVTKLDKAARGAAPAPMSRVTRARAHAHAE